MQYKLYCFSHLLSKDAIGVSVAAEYYVPVVLSIAPRALANSLNVLLANQTAASHLRQSGRLSYRQT